VTSGPIHILLSKKVPNPAARDKFLKAVEIIRADGTLTRILSVYLR